jgi:hypothetical protein
MYQILLLEYPSSRTTCLSLYKLYAHSALSLTRSLNACTFVHSQFRVVAQREDTRRVFWNRRNTYVEERPHSGFSPSAHASAHAVSGIPPKLHQSDNSDHTKRQFELVTRLGQSHISNYAAFSARPPLCPVRYTTGITVCSVNLQVNY